MNNDAFSKDGITMIKRESLLCVYIDTRVCVLKSGKIIISDLELAFHLCPLTLTGEKEKNMNMNKRNRPIERVSTCRRGDDGGEKMVGLETTRCRTLLLIQFRYR